MLMSWLLPLRSKLEKKVSFRERTSGELSLEARLVKKDELSLDLSNKHL